MGSKLGPRTLKSVALMVGLILLMTGCLSAEQDTALQALNNDRVDNGRSELVTDGTLQAKAQAWAEKLARDGYLHHSVLTDGAPSCWRGLAENVGYGGSIQQIQDAYMRSPGHRKNILNGSYTKVGVGVASKGDRIYTTQVFMFGC